MKYIGRILAGLYAAIVLGAVLLAVTVDLYLRNSPTEHLLPSAVLFFVTQPLSLTGYPLYIVAPSFFNLPLTQIGYCALCGAVQASLLWWWASPRKARLPDAIETQ
jgi:hypothetical protein